MILRVRDIYKIAEKILNTEDLSEHIGYTKREYVIFLLNHAGKDVFENIFQDDCGIELHLREHNGRIYSYQMDTFTFQCTKAVPISNETLRRFKLTETGEEFVKKYFN